MVKRNLPLQILLRSAFVSNSKILSTQPKNVSAVMRSVHNVAAMISLSNSDISKWTYCVRCFLYMMSHCSTSSMMGNVSRRCSIVDVSIYTYVRNINFNKFRACTSTRPPSAPTKQGSCLNERVVVISSAAARRSSKSCRP